MTEEKNTLSINDFAHHRIEIISGLSMKESKRMAGKKLLEIIKEVHATVPVVSEEELERDVEEAIKAVRSKSE